jgi:hypothetical protein
MKDVKESAKREIAQLTREDSSITGRFERCCKKQLRDGRKHILYLLINSAHTKVILLSVPHRHDLIKDSCVNREVKVFNGSLRNSLKFFGKVELIDVVNEREFFTKHGHHLNCRGKEIMVGRIAQAIECKIKKKVDPTV